MTVGPSARQAPRGRDVLIVAYRRGTTSVRRWVANCWLDQTVGPGDVSLLTCDAADGWAGAADVEAAQVYLRSTDLVATGRRMYQREVREVEPYDEVKADDPAIHRAATLLSEEAAQGAAGSGLMVAALTGEIAVHILRRHARVVFGDAAAGLTPRQERVVRDYVDAHLRERISLDELAGAVSLSRYQFIRRFRESIGTTPHQFLLRRRVDRVKDLIGGTDVPLLDVAGLCGFADQSHMTREFKKRVGVTPGRFRGDGDGAVRAHLPGWRDTDVRT